jgi:branched-chain amino acid transport system ATP-binding protein
VQRDPHVIQAYLGAGERAARSRSPRQTSCTGPALELHQVEAGYGGIRALNGVSLTVGQGEVVTLIGSNGAGKTTTLKVIAGLVQARSGAVRIHGQRVSGLPPHKIVARGVSVVPEGRGIFQRMTVLENLLMGAFGQTDPAVVESDLARVFELFPRLRERQRQAGGTLSGGEQQMLAIGRALMARPKLLLLDEPSLGLAPLLVETIFDVIQTINAQGTTILLIEQNARRALEIADRGYVLQSGRVVLTDSAPRLLASTSVQDVYLGGQMATARGEAPAGTPTPSAGHHPGEAARAF